VSAYVQLDLQLEARLRFRDHSSLDGNASNTNSPTTISAVVFGLDMANPACAANIALFGCQSFSPIEILP
jgi:hypothetical protein